MWEDLSVSTKLLAGMRHSGEVLSSSVTNINNEILYVS